MTAKPVPAKWVVGLEEAARFFRVDVAVILTWTREGCPVSGTGERVRFSLPDIHAWHMKHADERVLSKTDYNTRKIVADAMYKEAQAERIRGELMPRDEHMAIVRDWAASFKTFWAEAVKKNWHHFIDQPAESVRVLFEEFGRQLMEKWIGEK